MTDRVHIGKSFTHFQGHSDVWGAAVWSWADWRAVLAQPGVSVQDEYGHALPVPAFVAAVEATGLAARRRQFDAARRGPAWAGHYWLDPEGFTFTDGHFV